MTLQALLTAIGEIGINDKLISFAAAGGSIYELNDLTIRDYPILYVSPTGTHRISDNFTTYALTIFYLDRLLEDSSNGVDIHSSAIEILKNIIKKASFLDGVIGISDEYTIQLFTETERMKDRCNGAYANVEFTLINDSTCVIASGEDSDYCNDCANDYCVDCPSDHCDDCPNDSYDCPTDCISDYCDDCVSDCVNDLPQCEDYICDDCSGDCLADTPDTGETPDVRAVLATSITEGEQYVIYSDRGNGQLARNIGVPLPTSDTINNTSVLQVTGDRYTITKAGNVISINSSDYSIATLGIFTAHTENGGYYFETDTYFDQGLGVIGSNADRVGTRTLCWLQSNPETFNVDSQGRLYSTKDYDSKTWTAYRATSKPVLATEMQAGWNYLYLYKVL